MSLGVAPATPVTDTAVEFGTYRGSCASTTLGVGSRIGRYTRIRHEKRWQRFWVADDALAIGGAIIALGPVGIASLWVFDRTDQEMLIDTVSVLPPFVVHIDNDPMAATTATARFLDCRFAIGQRGGRRHVLGRMNGTKLTFGYETRAADPITAVCPVDADHRLGATQSVNITEKSACLPVAGWIKANDRRYRFRDRAIGMLDYSHGLFGRETTWQWAIASGYATDGTAVGFNIVDGFNNGLENVMWIDGVPQTIESVTTAFEDDTAWRIETADGDLSVTLTAEDSRCHNTTFGPFSWYSHQPLGRWYGTVGDRTVDGIYGVAEIHESRW